MAVDELVDLLKLNACEQALGNQWFTWYVLAGYKVRFVLTHELSA